MSAQPHNTEFHEFRRLGIGGSDAPVLMNGVHFGKTPYMLWEEKHLGKHEDKDSYAMKRGRDNEEAGRIAFKELTHITVEKKDYVVHPDIPWLRCNLDGIDPWEEVVVEIKNAGADDHVEALHGKVPHKYVPQVQHIRLVLPKIKEVHYVSLNKDFPVAHVIVKPDKAYEAELFKKEQEFWDHVLKGKPPELNEHDYVNMAQNPEWLACETELADLRILKKSLEEKDDELVSVLKALSGERSAKGLRLVMQKQMCQGAVDYAKVPQLEGVDLSPYRKKSFTKWPIRLI